jgi:hypothetical protein
VPARSVIGATVTSHQRGVPLAVGQKASKREAASGASGAVAASIAWRASSGQSSAQGAAADGAEIVYLHRANAVAVHVEHRAVAADQLQAVGALIEHRRQHAVRRIGKGRGQKQLGRRHMGLRGGSIGGPDGLFGREERSA